MKNNTCVILMDCWHNYKLEFLYKKIISWINSKSNIDSVILASYDTDSSELDNDIWYKNFKTTKKTPSIGDKFTSSIILDYTNPNFNQLAIRDIDDFQRYINVRPWIKNVYVLGVSIDNCIKHRPLGYINLNKYTKLNILTNLDCVISKVKNYIPENYWIRFKNNDLLLNKKLLNDNIN